MTAFTQFRAALLTLLFLLSALPGVALGAAVSWGNDNNGQLGNAGGFDQSLVPVNVVGSGALSGKTVTQVGAGADHSCAIADGKAYCWGGNFLGQLGTGTAGDQDQPTAVDTSGVLAGKTVTQISVGSQQTCAVADGAVYCWGHNNNGQLGDSTGDNRFSPVAVCRSNNPAGSCQTSTPLDNKTVTQVSTLIQTCVVADGAAYCWGFNHRGQLGNGSTMQSSIPVAVNTSGVLAGKTVTQIGSGGSHTCAIADGAAYCWGIGSSGRLGSNGGDSAVPVAVCRSNNPAGSCQASTPLNNKTVTQLSAGGGHTCVVADGAVSCWGLGNAGQIGNGQNFSVSLPTAVCRSNNLTGCTTSTPLDNKTVTQINVSTNTHACAVADGKAYCWGNNGNGQLGNNSTTSTNVPVAVDDSDVLSGKIVAQISGGSPHTLALAVSAPGAPTALSATAGDAQASISFTAGSDGGSAIGNYKFSIDNGASYTAFAPAVTISPVTITGLTNGATYQIKLRAVNAAGDGAESAAVSVTPVAPVVNGACGSASGSTATAAKPTTHLCLTGTSTTVTGNNNGKWNWDCNGSGGGTNTTGLACSAPYASQTISNFAANPASTTVGASSTVTADNSSGLTPVLSSSTTGFCTLGTQSGAGMTATATVAGTHVGTCTVKANRAGTGDTGASRYLAAMEQSLDITVGKGAQTITFGTAPSVVIGGTGTVSATSSAGLAVTFTSFTTNVCTVNGSTVTGVAAGTCTIAGDQAGNADYNAATQVTQNITVAGAGGSGTTDVPVQDTNGRTLLFSTSAGTIMNLRAVATPGEAAAMSGISFPTGFFAFDITLPGGVRFAKVSIELPAGVGANALVKCVGGTCRQLTGVAVAVTRRTGVTTLSYIWVDNGADDGDPRVGFISDTIGPAIVTPARRRPRQRP